MKKKRHTPEQIIAKLREADAMLVAGRTIGQVVQHLAVSEPTYHRWRNQYGGMKATDAKRLKLLEQEERAAEEACGRPVAGQRHAQGGGQGGILSPTKRRTAVTRLQRTFTVSQRRACRVLDQPRSTQRYQSRPHDQEKQLVKRMHQHVRHHPRYGYRRIWALLRLDGWIINRKRVHRRWRREGFKVPVKQRKKRRLGSSVKRIIRRQAEHKYHVWCWDFIHDTDERGRPLKWLSLIDEYTRECLALEVARSITAADAIDVLAEVFVIRGVPGHVRSDNGPEFIAKAIRSYLKAADVQTLYVAPASPWENGYAESFHSRLRDELLNAGAVRRPPRGQDASGSLAKRVQPPKAALGAGVRSPGHVRGDADGPPVGAPPLPPAQSAKDHPMPQTLISTGT